MPGGCAGRSTKSLKISGLKEAAIEQERLRKRSQKTHAFRMGLFGCCLDFVWVARGCFWALLFGRYFLGVLSGISGCCAGETARCMGLFGRARMNLGVGGWKQHKTIENHRKQLSKVHLGLRKPFVRHYKEFSGGPKAMKSIKAAKSCSERS